MKSKPNILNSVLWPALAVILWLMAACSSSHTPLVPYDEASSHWDAIVDEHITDAQRAETLKRLGRQLNRLQAGLKTEVEALNKELIALNVDYASTRDDLQQAVAAFTEKRHAVLTEYRDIIFSMRRKVSAEEWDVLME